MDAVLLLALWLAAADPCAEPVSPQMAQQLYEQLRALPASNGCTLESVNTDRDVVRVRWKRDGRVLPEARLTFGSCGAERGWTIAAPAELEQACPIKLSALPKTVASVTAPRRGLLHQCTVGLFAVAFVLVLVWLGALLLRGGWRRDPRWVLLVLASFALAVAARLVVEPTMLTWYSDTLPTSGAAAWERFGPGGYVWQEFLRAILPWTDTTVFRANAILGAAAVPLFVLILRERRVPLVGAAAFAVLFALAPLHVRVSASPREHVLAQTATILLLWCWIRAHRRGDWMALAIALLLIPVVALIRPDSWVLLVAVPLFTLLRDPGDENRLGRRPALAFYAVWAAVGVLVYFAVVIPSHHPGPHLGDQVSALVMALPQFILLAVRSPWWWSPVALLLAVPGVMVMARQRRALLAAVGIYLLAAFGLVGRTFLYDELTGAHYFQTTIPMMLVPAAFGFEWLRERVRVPAWAALPMLLAATFVPALRAYRVRYTFQDEYRFLRGALAALPDGCSVVALPVRSASFERDPDCCLDVARSPLMLAYPRLRFVTVDQDVVPTDGCVAYYRGAACSFQDTVGVRGHHAAAARYFARACALVADGAPIADGEVTDHTADDLFAGRKPRVRLTRR
jgi:hypothetical protein